MHLIPAIRVRIPGLVAGLPAVGAPEVISEHRSDREAPVRERPLPSRSSAEDYERPDPPRPRGPELRRDVPPPRPDEELGKKGACTAGLFDFIWW